MIIIQPEMFHKKETLQEFVDELKNIPHLIVDDFDFIEKESKKLNQVDVNQPCTFLHTLTLYKTIPQKINQFFPGTLFNFEDYSFTHLSSRIPRELLVNSDYEIKTMGDLIQNFPFGGFFVKPNSGNKLFTGDIFDGPTFIREFGQYQNDYPRLMIIAPPKNILSEFRFHIFGKEILSQAFYTYNEEWEPSEDHKKLTLDFMRYVLKNWDLCELLNKPALVIDVAVLENDEVGIVEHNCFNTSGIYPGSDVKGIIQGLQNLLELD